MFAPLVAQARTKADDVPRSQFWPQHATLAPRVLVSGAVEQARMLGGTIGNQASASLLVRHGVGPTGKKADSDHEAILESPPAENAMPGPSWDFSKIRLSSPDTANGPDAPSSQASKPVLLRRELGALGPTAISAANKSDSALALADPPASASPPASAQPRAAPTADPARSAAAADPTMTSGTVTIISKPLDVEKQGSEVFALSMGYRITKPLTVSVIAPIDEPADSEPFEYGLVQNVLFDHIEMVYSAGDMLVDSVGPMVDYDASNPSEAPYIHANAGPPSMLFATKRAAATFVDRPFLDVKLYRTHCEKNVTLSSVSRSLALRVGLVARGLKSQRLVPLAAAPDIYGFQWRLDFTGAAWTSSEKPMSPNSCTLSTSAIPVVTDGAVAVEASQKALDAETAAFTDGCENAP